jgi:hypothetical protein
MTPLIRQRFDVAGFGEPAEGRRYTTEPGREPGSVIVEVGGIEPPCLADRLGLLRAQPGGKISPPGSHRRSTLRPARVRCPPPAPGRNRWSEPAG